MVAAQEPLAMDVSIQRSRSLMSPIVHIVDDDRSFRSALARSLRRAGYEVASYENAQQFLDQLPNSSEPGCILLDIRMPGLSGPHLQDKLSALGSTLPIIFLTGNGDIPTSVHAIKAGAEDFLTKPVPRAALIVSIQKALARQRQHLERENELNPMRSSLATLTQRERQVYDLVVRGKMNKQIAFELGATERTIKAHRHKVMEKLRVQTIAELVSFKTRLVLQP
jgi:RNA polymerase sigma factor (sigma-70 family)